MSEDVTLDEFIESEDTETVEMEGKGLREEGFLTLPYDWDISTVDEVAKEGGLVDGDWIESDDMDEDGEIQLVQLGHIGEGQFKGEPDRFITKEFAEEEDCTILSEGDLLISRMQEPILRACLLPSFEKDSIMAVDIARLQETKEWNRHLLKYLFNSRPIWKQGIAWASGTTRKRISRKNIEKLRLPTPPLEEQRKIATVLYNVDQAIQKTEEIIEQTHVVRNALMQNMFHGRHETFEDYQSTPVGEIPSHWSVTSIGDVLHTAQYGISESLSKEGQYPIFRMNNIENGYMVDRPLKYIDLDDEKFEKYRVKEGDILFNRTNSLELVGKTGIYELEGDHVFASYLVRLQTNDKADTYYLNYYMNSPEAQNRMMDFATKGVSQANINANSIQQVQLPLPPLDEQKEIVDKIRSVDSQIEANQQYKYQLNRLKQGFIQDLLSGTVRTTDTNIEVPDEIAQHG